MFSPVTHHWVDRIPPLQSWFSSQLPCLCPGENKCVPGSRYKHRLQVEEQHLCDVLPMKVKKLNFKDQRSISGNLRRNSQVLAMLTKCRPLEGSQHCRSHSETWWTAWPPLRLSSSTLQCPSLWSPCLEWRSSLLLTAEASSSGIITSLLPMLNENCSPRSRDESNLDLKIERE